MVIKEWTSFTFSLNLLWTFTFTPPPSTKRRQKRNMNDTSVALPIQRNTSGPSVSITKLEGIAWCSAFLLAFVFAVVENLLIITLLIAVNKGLRKKCMFLVVYMAFADLMLAFLAFPIRVYFVGIPSQLWTAELL